MKYYAYKQKVKEEKIGQKKGEGEQEVGLKKGE